MLFQILLSSSKLLVEVLTLLSMFVGVVTHGFSPSFDVLLKLDSKQLIYFRKTGKFNTAEGVIKNMTR